MSAAPEFRPVRWKLEPREYYWQVFRVPCPACGAPPLHECVGLPAPVQELGSDSEVPMQAHSERHPEVWP